jgi:hypothetical protein
MHERVSDVGKVTTTEQPSNAACMTMHHLPTQSKSPRAGRSIRALLAAGETYGRRSPAEVRIVYYQPPAHRCLYLAVKMTDLHLFEVETWS